MRKNAKIALWSIAAVAVAAGCAAAGFYAGFGLGARTMTAMAETNAAHDALAHVRLAMVALDKNDLDLSQRQLAINLRIGLYALGSMQMAGVYARCTEKEKDALISATSYVALHADMDLFKPDPFLLSATKFCLSGQGVQKSNVGN